MHTGEVDGNGRSPRLDEPSQSLGHRPGDMLLPPNVLFAPVKLHSHAMGMFRAGLNEELLLSS
jgi:hypothetical protein